MSTHQNDYSAASDFINTMNRLPNQEFDQLFAQLLVLRASRKAKSLNAQESTLLQQINKPIPDQLQQRFDQLSVKKSSGLTKEEHEEYLQTIEQIEQLDVLRLQNLSELAKIRQVPLRQVMKDLGIQQPAYV